MIELVMKFVVADLSNAFHTHTGVHRAVQWSPFCLYFGLFHRQVDSTVYLNCFIENIYFFCLFFFFVLYKMCEHWFTQFSFVYGSYAAIHSNFIFTGESFQYDI